MLQGEILNPPNLMSLLRLVMAWPLGHSLWHKKRTTSLVLIAIMLLTDWADGYLARRQGQVTELGKNLDPIADKVCIAVTAIALHKKYGLPLWVLVLLLVRDTLILAGGAYLVGGKHVSVQANMVGKIAANIIAALFISYIVAPLQPVRKVLLWLTVGASAASLSSYGKVLKRNLHPAK